MHTRSPAIPVLLLAGLFGGPAAAQEALDMRLANAGFVMRVAKTAPEMERLKKLPARKMVARTIDGKRFYLYADPATCQCVMVGDQRALQTFRDMRAAGPSGPRMCRRPAWCRKAR